MDDYFKNVGRDFLSLSYKELEELNLKSKERRKDRSVQNLENLESEYKKFLKGEEKIKAVIVAFSDLEGRFHTLDYDKKYLLESSDNLTFDGSSVKGFSNVDESDLRLKLDWASFYFLPSNIFGDGKVMVFADIYTKDNKPHECDIRSKLKLYMDILKKKGIDSNIGTELEGFLVNGVDAEMNFREETGFELVSLGGYYHSLPKDKLKLFIDATAEAQRALGFENEKDHPEVAPSQFELNYKYTDPINSSDQIQLYKLVARQIADNMECTATFLPKPFTNINGSGMHTNISLFKNGRNVFFDAKQKMEISKSAEDFIARVLTSANEISLILNPSVNAYRRLDPRYEAPNQIKYSFSDRSSMIRIPAGNMNSTRIEVRSVGSDANPYLTMYTLLKIGLEGPKEELQKKGKRVRTRTLPGNIFDAIRIFKYSDSISEILGETTKSSYVNLKEKTADRAQKDLGKYLKKSEVLFHHEITNQYLWSEY